MTAAERKRLTIAAVRNARRYYRRADSQGEVLERWLDRMVKRKTEISREQALAVEPRWNAYRDSVRTLEKALADMLNYLIDPGIPGSNPSQSPRGR